MNRLLLAGLFLRTCFAITTRHDARAAHETISSGVASELSFFRKLGIEHTYGLKPIEFQAVMESSWGPKARTGTLALLSANETHEESCHDAQPGSMCYHATAWLHAEGLAKYPDWYPSLSEDSTAQEVQAVLHALGKADCPKPCQTRTAKRLAQSLDDRVLEVDDTGRQVLSEAYELSEPTDCGHVVEGDWCYLSIMWLKNMGLDKHPDWYPRLTRESSIQDFQTVLHNNGKVGCPLPCSSWYTSPKVAEEPVTITKPSDITRAVVSPSAKRVNAEFEECEIPQEGSRCYNAIRNVIQVGLEVHPEMYPELSASSSREEVQEHLYLRRQYDCGRPCPKEQVAKHRRTRRVKMNVADMTESEMNMYLNHEWDGYVDSDEYVDGASSEENAFEEYTNAVAADSVPAANLSAAERVPPAEDASHEQQLSATETTLHPEGNVDAEALPAVNNEMAQEPSEAYKGECRDASVGELCHQAVTWARTVGILERPSWYTGLSRSSTFKEFQAFLHETRGSLCTMPCPGANGASAPAGGAARPGEEDPALEELVPDVEEQRANSTGQEPVPEPQPAAGEAGPAAGGPAPRAGAAAEEAPQPESATEAASSAAQEELVLQPQAETVQVDSTDGGRVPQPEAATVEEEADQGPLPWVAEEEPLPELLPEAKGDGQGADSAVEKPARQPENATEEANLHTDGPEPQPEAATVVEEPLPELLPEVKGDEQEADSASEKPARQPENATEEANPEPQPEVAIEAEGPLPWVAEEEPLPE